MSLNAAALQAQVRANSAELASYLHDLHSWEKDIKQKEQNLQAGAISLTKQQTTVKPSSSSSSSPPIRSSQPPVSLPSTASSDSHRFSVHKERGNALYAKADYHAAIAEYNQCAILLPLDPLPLSNRAQCWLKLRQWAEADRDCTAALELDGTNVKALYRRALARKGLGKIDEAAADVDRVLAIEPANKPALQLRRDVQLAVEAAGRAGGGAARTAGGVGVKGMEQPRRKLVIEEEAEDEDDEEEEEEAFTVKRGTTTASRASAVREEKEQSSSGTKGTAAAAFASRGDEERKAAPTQPAARSAPAVKDTVAAAQPLQPTGAPGLVKHARAASVPSSSQLSAITASPTSASLASSSAPRASSSAASLDLRVPRSALDFDSQYRRVRQQPAQLAVLLQLIPSADYPSILRTALDSSLLSSIVNAVDSMLTSVVPAFTHCLCAAPQLCTSR